jgi:ribosomal protein L40E
MAEDAAAKTRKRPRANGAKRAARPARDPERTATRAAALESADAIESERALGRWFAVILPAGTALLAIAIGSVTSIGPGILVLAAGALLGAIALLWSSLRTLAGDAALPEELEAIDGIPLREDPLQARKKELLRALKDLAHDHAVGKIDAEDFEDLDTRYREQAKAVMREIDLAGTPSREKAEKLAREHLAKAGLRAAAVRDSSEDVADDRDDDEEEEPVDEDDADSGPLPEPVAIVRPAKTAARPRITERQTCASCGTSNEGDATFCKKCGASLAPTSAEEREAAENAS